eukprot:14040414-Heterocapsa_arctica.AAC.1
MLLLQYYTLSARAVRRRPFAAMRGRGDALDEGRIRSERKREFIPEDRKALQAQLMGRPCPSKENANKHKGRAM